MNIGINLPWEEEGCRRKGVLNEGGRMKDVGGKECERKEDVRGRECKEGGTIKYIAGKECGRKEDVRGRECEEGREDEGYRREGVWEEEGS